MSQQEGCVGLLKGTGGPQVFKHMLKKEKKKRRFVNVLHAKTHNIGQPVPTPMKDIMHTEEPFQIVQIYFSDTPPCGRFEYLLVCVCQLSGWVEAYPNVKHYARTVVKFLTREMITRCGI